MERRVHPGGAPNPSRDVFAVVTRLLKSVVHPGPPQRRESRPAVPLLRVKAAGEWRLARPPSSPVCSSEFCDTTVRWSRFMSATTAVPAGASAAILLPSSPMPDSAVSVQGPDFDSPHSLQAFLKSYERIGFQATSLGRAINTVNRMVSAKNCSPHPSLNSV